MISFDEVRDILDEAVEGIPREVFRELNGGVVLLPEKKFHPESRGDLYIMGEYNHQPRGLGRFITIFYGSFVETYGNAPRRVQVEKLTEVLRHELVHHLESLAGDISLEIKDAADIQRYKDRRSGRG